MTTPSSPNCPILVPNKTLRPLRRSLADTILHKDAGELCSSPFALSIAPDAGRPTGNGSKPGSCPADVFSPCGRKGILECSFPHACSDCFPSSDAVPRGVREGVEGVNGDLKAEVILWHK